MNQEEFEKKVMDMLLAGDDLVLGELRQQYENSTVASRKFDGAGFYTDFKVREGIPPVKEKKRFQIGDVRISMNGVKDAVGVVLFVENGYLSVLDGYSSALDDWPDKYSNVILEYMSADGNRDLNDLRKSWV